MLTKLCYICSKVCSSFCNKCKQPVCNLHYNKETGQCINCKSGLIISNNKKQ